MWLANNRYEWEQLEWKDAETSFCSGSCASQSWMGILLLSSNCHHRAKHWMITCPRTGANLASANVTQPLAPSDASLGCDLVRSHKWKHRPKASQPRTIKDKSGWFTGWCQAFFPPWVMPKLGIRWEWCCFPDTSTQIPDSLCSRIIPWPCLLGQGC